MSKLDFEISLTRGQPLKSSTLHTNYVVAALKDYSVNVFGKIDNFK